MGGMTVHRFIVAGSLLLVGLMGLVCIAETSAADDTAKAAATRKLLSKKVSLKFKSEFLKDILDEIQDQVKGVKFQVDTKGGVSRNKRMTIECKDAPLEEALDKMLGKEDLGYIVISDAKNAYDGLIMIKMGKERGYAAGQEPKKDK